jgi:hypothetical protein
MERGESINDPVRVLVSRSRSLERDGIEKALSRSHFILSLFSLIGNNN